MWYRFRTSFAVALPLLLLCVSAQAGSMGGARTGGSSDAAMIISIGAALAVGFLLRGSVAPFRPLPTAILAGLLVNLLIA